MSFFDLYIYDIALTLMGVSFATVFIMRKDLRLKMVLMSVFGSIAGPVSELWFTSDYWRPVYGSGLGIIEDFIFSGILVALTSTTYNVYFRKESTSGNTNPSVKRTMLDIFIPGAAFSFVILALMEVFVGIFHINSIYASSIAFCALAALMWMTRHDLLAASLAGGLIIIPAVAITYNLLFIIYPNLISNWWIIGNITGIMVLNVPLEEYIWFISWGLVGTPLYEWLLRKKYVSMR
jgi:hypothetical protein